MKKLIVSGDSNTDLGFRSSSHPDWDVSFKKWPEHLAEHLGMELVCLGRGGNGNEFIYHTILEEITNTPKEEIGLVIAAWTQCHRKDWQKRHKWNATRVDQDGDLLYWVKRSMNHRLSFQILCERYKLPHYQFQMIDLFENYIQGLKPTEQEFLSKVEAFDDLSYSKKIEAAFESLHGLDVSMEYPGDIEKDRLEIIKIINWYKDHINSFIGWPGLINSHEVIYHPDYTLEDIKHYLDQKNNMIKMDWGLVMTMHMIFKSGEDRFHHTISKIDDHPNAEGHKYIADFLIKELRL